MKVSTHTPLARKALAIFDHASAWQGERLYRENTCTYGLRAEKYARHLRGLRIPRRKFTCTFEKRIMAQGVGPVP
jgi:hypothetical protein